MVYTGKYQDRYNFYRGQLPQNDEPATNIYLDIFRCIVKFHNLLDTNERYYQTTNTSRVDITSWEAAISAIRETEGLARCWGHASKFLSYLQDWRNAVAVGGTTNLSELPQPLFETISSLLDLYLEMLPSYVNWSPTAVLPANQIIIDLLQIRGNGYRAIGNTKFYAYDLAVENIAKCNFLVNENNCKYIHGVGPRISQHIADILRLSRTPTVDPAVTPTVTPTVIPIVTPTVTPTPVVKLASAYAQMSTIGNTIPVEELPIAEPTPEIMINPNAIPSRAIAFADERTVNPANQDLADYLRQGAQELYRKSLEKSRWWRKYRGQYWAWVRARESVLTTEISVRELEPNGYSQLSNIGDKMALVLDEFYNSSAAVRT